MQITLENISKSYVHKNIFQNIDYQFLPAHRYGVSGYNGSGKSTFLKIVSGFVTPSSGQIVYTVGKKNVAVEDIYRYISYTAPYMDIPLDLDLYRLFDFHFSIRSRWMSKTNDEINAIFQLPQNIPLRQFSSGMQQRAKLALAFFTNAKLLLLDEPTETLDISGVELYQQLLENYTEGKTVLIASNKQSDFINCAEVLNILDYQNKG